MILLGPLGGSHLVFVSGALWVSMCASDILYGSDSLV